MIAYDATSKGTWADGANSLTMTHTCSGANRLLLVAMEGYYYAPTGITYNGVAMTLLKQQFKDSAETGLGYNQVWGLLNPAEGAHDIVASYTYGYYMRFVNVSYTGVSQSGLPDAVIGQTSANAGDATLTTPITTVADNCWIFCSVNSALGGATSSTGTVRDTQQYCTAIDSNGAKTPAGVYNTQSGNNVSYFITHAVVSFAPAVTTFRKSIVGVLVPSVKKVGGVAIANASKVIGLS